MDFFNSLLGSRGRAQSKRWAGTVRTEGRAPEARSSTRILDPLRLHGKERGAEDAAIRKFSDRGHARPAPPPAYVSQPLRNLKLLHGSDPQPESEPNRHLEFIKCESDPSVRKLLSLSATHGLRALLARAVSGRVELVSVPNALKM